MAVLCTTTGGQEHIRAFVCGYDQSAWTVKEAWSNAHSASTGAQLY